MICPHCGAQAQGNFCSNCGARLEAGTQPTAEDAPQTTEPSPVPTYPPPSVPPTASPAATQAPPDMAPDVPAPPAPAPPSAALCPVCRIGTLSASEHKGLLHTSHEVTCNRCGAVLVGHGGQPQRFELTETRNPAEPNWQRYEHETLTVAEWQRIAAGGLSDAELQEADLAEAMSELRAGRIRLEAATNPPILLHAGEQAVFVLSDVSLHEPRSVTRGAYGGPSIHVAKGLTLRVGGFQAQSHEELKAIDSGMLVLTSKRLCYAGRLRSIEVPLAKLISVDPYSDAVAIRRSGKEKTEFFFGLDHHSYSFTVQGCSYQEPMSGLILKYAIEGLLAQAG